MNRCTAALLFVLPLAGCEACFTFVPIEGARAEVVRGDDDALEAIALVVPFDVLQDLEQGVEGFEVAHAFVPIEEDQASEAFPVLIDIGHNKIGHPPVGVWTVPHFDIHFYAMTEAEVRGVVCDGQPTPAAEKVPAGLVVGECVDGMGVHAHAPANESTTDPAPLADKKAEVIVGYDQGELTFLEPMLFAEPVFRGEDLDADVARPSRLGRATLWPARFEGRLDEAANAYRFQLVDWSPIE